MTMKLWSSEVCPWNETCQCVYWIYAAWFGTELKSKKVVSVKKFLPESMKFSRSEQNRITFFSETHEHFSFKDSSKRWKLELLPPSRIFLQCMFADPIDSGRSNPPVFFQPMNITNAICSEAVRNGRKSSGLFNLPSCKRSHSINDSEVPTSLTFDEFIGGWFFFVWFKSTGLLLFQFGVFKT